MELSEEEKEIDYTMTNHIIDLETLIALDKRAMEDIENNTHNIGQEEILTIIRECIRLKNDYDKQQKEIEELKKYKQYYETTKIVWNRNDYISKAKIRKKIKELRKEEDRIEKLDYRAEPEKAIDVVLLRIADLEELLEEK